MDDGVTHFLNVDMEVDSKNDLQPLMDAFGKKVLVLRCDRWKRTYGTRLEVASGRRQETADTTIRAFCRLIEELPNAARRHWDEAQMRNFSIGIRAGFNPSASDFTVSAETVRRVAKLNASIMATVYPAERPKLARLPASRAEARSTRPAE